MTKNIHVPTRLLNTPLMVTVDSVDLILKALTHSLNIQSMFFFNDESISKTMTIERNIAIIPVIGGLTYRGYGWIWDTTYDQIRKNFRQAIGNPEIKTIVFDIDSSGGEAAGVFDLVDEIYSSRKIKPIYAIANEDALSGAYAIASAADKIYLSRTASVGSIGVIAVHVDQSSWDKKLGEKYTTIFAGAHKNDFSQHEPLSESAKEIAKKSINSTYEMFVQTVARNRKMKVDAIKSTEALIYKGQDAVDIGLADKVLSFEQAMEDIISKVTNRGIFMEISELKQGLESFIGDGSKKAEVITMLSDLGFKEANSIESSITQAKGEGEKEGKKEGEKQALSRVSEILELCNLAGMPHIANSLITDSSLSIESARKKIIEAKASQSMETEIRTTVHPLSTGEVNPLLNDAKRRAAKEK
ncbi:MAG: S49 family peptidase [Desulfobacterales bacterium]|nr:S49 family peptidase [Desulfobacterales bacterium]